MKDLTAGFLLGIIASIIAAIVLNFISSKFYARFKYRKFLGEYNHDNGKVRIKHLHGNFFQATGYENIGVIWKSNLEYHKNLVFSGTYDWKPSSGLSDWGEHLLHVLPSGDISVIWTNKSIDKENKGRLIWKKIKS